MSAGLKGKILTMKGVKMGKMFNEMCDMFCQDIVNAGHEISWEKGTKPIVEINKLQKKAGLPPYVRTPKHDPMRGSGVGGEGFGILLKTITGLS